MEFLIQLLIATVEMGTPLLLATLGGVISERAGVINLGMEGLMLVGALTGLCYGREIGWMVSAKDRLLYTTQTVSKNYRWNTTRGF